MAKFYDLKKSLHFPRAAGTLNRREDVSLLHALLVNERAQAGCNFRDVQKILAKAGEIGAALRLAADYRQLDACYGDDIKLCAEFIESEGLVF